MRQFIKKISLFLLFSTALSLNSCVITTHKDNGKHKGWYKNKKNPHNPNTTNPAPKNGKGNGKGNGKK